MKKVIIASIVIIIALVLSACSTSLKLPDGYEESKVVDEAKEIVLLLNDQKFEEINQRTRKDLQDDLSTSVLKETYNSTLSDFGEFEEFKKITTLGQKDKEKDEEYAVIVLECNYENSKTVYTISFNKEYKIVGFYIK